MSTEYSIRDALPADAPAIAQLLASLYRHEGFDVQPEAGEIARALFAEDRAVKTRALVAAGAADAVVAVLLYYPGYDTLSSSEGYHLADMVVAENARRAGLGRRLVRALAAQAEAEARQWISLTALRSNDSAAEFYASLGMQEVNVRFYALGAQGFRSLIGQ